MLPAGLNPESFAGYPPLSRQLATSHVALLRQLPLSFLPLLLREVISYDWKFPAERADLDRQLSYLDGLTQAQLGETMAPFVRLHLPDELVRLDWVNSLRQFSEKLTAHLWASHQIDAFRIASVEYIRKMNAAIQHAALPTHRLGIAILGQGVGENRYPLFRKLRPQGVYFSNVSAENGCRVLLDAVARRAAAHPLPFAHWYVDGGTRQSIGSTPLTSVDYSSLDSVRIALVDKMRRVMQPGGGGPEVLRTMLATMRPEDLGMSGAGDAAVLNRFQISVLTEGSGTQLFSTTFVQWSAREVLRRAQSLTLLARFSPRLREQSMRELLAGNRQTATPDAEGALIDADMGSYYTWINQQRLPGADQARFFVWFEGHREAVAVGPNFSRGAVDPNPTDLSRIVDRLV